ncbi:MAG TPA: hypothetical protein VNX29_07085 [Kaistia sp.]|nr:hypothetical protein [Kaistia sp.]
MDGSVAMGLLSGAIALMAAAIAWGQWFTAREKLVVDVFEKRFSVYIQALKALSPVIRNGSPSEEDLLNYMLMMREARFLFGQDVYGYLSETWDELLSLQAAVEELKGPLEPPDRQLIVKRKWHAFRKVADFPRSLHTLVAPYMKMQNKRPRTPVEWFADANAARISAADGQD